MDVSSRYGELDTIFLRRGSQPADKDGFYSVETLLDSLMVLYQECCSSSMRRERTITEFVDSGTYYLVTFDTFYETFWHVAHTYIRTYEMCNAIYSWVSFLYLRNS